MQHYGEELIVHRLKAGISQRQLAKEIGTSSQTVSRWENNVVDPSISFCIKLADFYCISLDELIGRDVKGRE